MGCDFMGTDYVQLLDKRTARLIMTGDEETLAVLVDSRTRPVQGPPVWCQYWDLKANKLRDFSPQVNGLERLRILMNSGTTLHEIRRELIRVLCESDFLRVNYWGCHAKVFSGHATPPGGNTWEEFEAQLSGRSQAPPAFHRDEEGNIL